MNFLEQLTAEWYQYKGYFVRTNIKFGRNIHGRGGHAGEIDVIAYEPKTRDFIHIEASTDALVWPERKRIFERKFSDARRYYMEIFPFKEMDIKPRQIALVGFNLTPARGLDSWRSVPPSGSIWGELKIEVLHIPKFFQEINTVLLKSCVKTTYVL